MKKILALVVILSCFVLTSIGNAGFFFDEKVPPCFGNVDASRLVRMPKYLGGCYYYDKKALVKHNKFSPFGDRVIDVWIYGCPDENFHKTNSNMRLTSHTSSKRFISFNLDKRTMSLPLTNNPKYKNRPIVPNSSWEKYLNYFEDIY